jgi:hypothetical protein
MLQPLQLEKPVLSPDSKASIVAETGSQSPPDTESAVGEAPSYRVSSISEADDDIFGHTLRRFLKPGTNSHELDIEKFLKKSEEAFFDERLRTSASESLRLIDRLCFLAQDHMEGALG